MIGSQTSAILLLLAISFAALFFVVTYIFAAKITSTKRQIDGRVTQIVPKEKSLLTDFRGNEPENASNSKKKGIFKNRKIMDIIFEELLLADIMLKPEEFSVIWLVLAFVPSGLVALFSQDLMPSATLAGIGAAIPVFIINHRKKKRTDAFEAQLGDSLIVVCNCLRSGLTFQQAMETISKEMPAPISVEFARVLSEVRYGNPLEQALLNMTERIKSSDLMLTVSAVSIQRQTGGNLSEILETISETIKIRIKIKRDIKAITAQGRISGMMIGGLPIAMGSLLMVINSEYISLLFTEKLGRSMVTGAVIMELLGFYFIKKIITIKY